MAKLTFRIDVDLLRQARAKALREQTSLNALILDHLRNHISRRQQQLRALSALEAVAERSASTRAEAPRGNP